MEDSRERDREASSYSKLRLTICRASMRYFNRFCLSSLSSRVSYDTLGVIYLKCLKLIGVESHRRFSAANKRKKERKKKEEEEDE